MNGRRRDPFDRRELQRVDDDVRAELARRAIDIEAHFRLAAEKLGQLYLCADLHGLPGLTLVLDDTMRGTSDVERLFAALQQELQQASGRPRAGRA